MNSLFVIFLVLYFPFTLCEYVGDVSKPVEINNLLHEIILSNNFSDTDCVLDIVDAIDAISDLELWAVKMLDSIAKFQSGVAMGNVINLGDYDECMSVRGKTRSGHEVQGKYCLLILFLMKIPRPKINFAFPDDMNYYLNTYAGVPIIEGICLPNSCSTKFINDIINMSGISETLAINAVIDEKFCQPYDDQFYHFSNLDWIFMVIFGSTILLMVLCTVYDVYLLYSRKKPYHNILITYSMYTNMKQLTTVRKDPDQLSCVNGIRSISMIWILIVHKFIITFAYPHVNTIYIINEWLKDTKNSLILGAVYSVDTFFLISGMLIMYVVLLANVKQFKFNIIHYYLHRIFRLSPAIMMVILLYMTLLRFLSSGPIWPPAYRALEAPCKTNWWRSMLYMQNTIELGNVCVTQSWYLAVDTQLYILAPVFFFPIKKWPKQTIIILVILTCASCITSFVIAWQREFGGQITNLRETYFSMYGSIVARSNAWLIGAILGYFLFVKRGKRIQIMKPVVIFFWILTFCVMAGLIYLQAYFIQYEYNKLLSSLYYGFAKALWSSCISWIIFACVHGYGGLISRFLSMKYFIIFGRLTYTMYIVHIVVIFVIMGRGQTNTVFSNTDTILELLGEFPIILIVSIFWTLAFESPIIAIGKILMSADMSNKLTQIAQENANFTTERRNTKNYNTTL